MNATTVLIARQSPAARSASAIWPDLSQLLTGIALETRDESLLIAVAEDDSVAVEHVETALDSVHSGADWRSRYRVSVA